MEMKLANDDPNTMMFHRRVSENEIVEMGVYRVMFGYRVRAGIVGSPFCHLDWCGGGNWKDVERLYSLCYAILSSREESKKCFDGLPPVSQIKPFYNDFDFVRTLSQQAGEFELISLEK